MLTNFSFIKNVVHTSCLSISFMTVGPFRGVMVKMDGKWQATKRHNRVPNSSFGRGKWQAAMRHTLGSGWNVASSRAADPGFRVECGKPPCGRPWVQGGMLQV